MTRKPSVTILCGGDPTESDLVDVEAFRQHLRDVAAYKRSLVHGETLADQRLHAGLTIEQVATELHLPEWLVAATEKGEHDALAEHRMRALYLRLAHAGEA